MHFLVCAVVYMPSDNKNILNPINFILEGIYNWVSGEEYNMLACHFSKVG